MSEAEMHSGSRMTTVLSIVTAVVCAAVGAIGGVWGWMADAELRATDAELRTVSVEAADLRSILILEKYRTERLERTIAGLAAEQFAADQGSLAENVAALVRLTRERLELMPGVARAKWSAKRPIEDPQREQELLDDLVRRAGALSVESDALRTFFQDQMEAAKLVQRERFAEWESAGQKEFADAPDLARDVRPRIDAVTSRLLETFATLEPVVSLPEFVAALESRLAEEPVTSRGPMRRALASLLNREPRATEGAAAPP